ncbi:MAG TPA: isochorismatase family protein [Actinomycetes bacterium]|jgi:nicotinamidase/pyrazinamidase|nr:isochorismatase family protein [Actinomycetes bacterium]
MVDYDGSTALVVVDVQNDFADPKGSLYVAEGERVVPLANREIGRALVASAPVVYTQDWHPAQTPHFQSGGGVWPEHCVQHSWGASCTRTCGSSARWSARGRGARTATRASPFAIR